MTTLDFLLSVFRSFRLPAGGTTFLASAGEVFWGEGDSFFFTAFGAGVGTTAFGVATVSEALGMITE